MILSVLIGLTTYGQECNYRTNEVDEFTGNRKVVTVSELFIAHTDSLLKKYYRNKDHTTIHVSNAQIGEYKVLYLKLKILSKDAYKYYGAIYKGSECMFKTDKGMINLKFETSDTGDTNYDRDYTTYSTYIILTDEDITQFTDNNVEKIRFYWSKGYQDYNVSYPGLISTQIKCIK